MKVDPRLVTATLLVASLISAPAIAAIDADDADDVCTPSQNPCLVTTTVNVMPDAVLDFGTRTLRLQESGALDFGNTAGISVGDFDGDGWVDVFACQSAHLWRNVGGVDWELVADLKDALPFAAHRYGSVIADYDDDGLGDIGTEPRVLGGDACFHLLHNLGDAIFVDVAGDPAILDVQPCNSPGETWCVADVDGDRDLAARHCRGHWVQPDRAQARADGLFRGARHVHPDFGLDGRPVRLDQRVPRRHRRIHRRIDRLRLLEFA